MGFEPDTSLGSLSHEAAVMSALCVEPGEEDFVLARFCWTRPVAHLKKVVLDACGSVRLPRLRHTLLACRPAMA